MSLLVIGKLLVCGIWLLTGFSVYTWLMMARNQARGWENSVCLSHRVPVGHNPTILASVGWLCVVLTVVSLISLIVLIGVSRAYAS